MAGSHMPVREYPPNLWNGVETPEWNDDIDRVIEPLLNLNLPEEDGIPMETNWHRSAMNLLIDSVHALWHDRNDYFAGGNMFIHYSLDLVRNKDFLGPDFFVVKDVDGIRDRRTWTVWREGGRYPDVIVELSSQSTMAADLGKKKQIYERIFHTSEYFCYDPETRKLQGWQLVQNSYVALEPNAQGWLWSEEFEVWIGLWKGEFQRINDLWPRFFTRDHHLVLTLAEAEAQRADKAEEEIARLKALLADHGIATP